MSAVVTFLKCHLSNIELVCASTYVLSMYECMHYLCVYLFMDVYIMYE